MEQKAEKHIKDSATRKGNQFKLRTNTSSIETETEENNREQTTKQEQSMKEHAMSVVQEDTK